MIKFKIGFAVLFGLGFTATLVSGRTTEPKKYVEGLTPLTDLGTDTYLGFPGGLYPEGSNERPLDHEAAGMEIALNEIQPLDADGNPDPEEGKIVFVSLGMSNTTMEFSHFVPLAEEDTEINPQMTVIDTAQGGKAAFQWANPEDDCWTEFGQRLTDGGVTGKQVQVVWVKLACRKNELTESAFPERGIELAHQVQLAIANLKEKYPSVKIAYLSSRIYAGYATTNLNPEPYAYETGFAVKWLIQRQLNGHPALASEGEDAPFPWLSWGPYLWANGLGSDKEIGGVPGRSDGLEWFQDDLGPDGTHPSEQGRVKVAVILMEYLKSDVTSIPWFLETEEELQVPGEEEEATGTDSGGGSACGLLGLDAILFLGLLAIRSARKKR